MTCEEGATIPLISHTFISTAIVLFAVLILPNPGFTFKGSAASSAAFSFYFFLKKNYIIIVIKKF